MSMISSLVPHKLWQWFDTICAIPHPSFHEEALANHILAWAQKKGLDTYRDSVGNVFIAKPATQGYEQYPTIALQAHLDMVCQSNNDYDFLTQPIRPIIEGEWVRADGTTLGADNGIGLASILAILDSDDLAHPRLEAVLTMTEETGMVGAIGIEPKRLEARTMINTDTEEINEIYIGCAGGIDADMTQTLSFLPLTDDETLMECRIYGLKGGHSGIDIDKNHANAIKLLAYALSGLECRLVEFKGGTARNAIPRMASAVVAVKDKAKFLQYFETMGNQIIALIGESEPQAAWQVTQSDVRTAVALSSSDSQRLVDFINVLPNGVLRHSDKVADTVETSLSLGKIMLDETGLAMTSLIRSLNDIGKHSAIEEVKSACRLADVEVVFSGDYVGWSPNPASDITQLTKAVYRTVIGAEPVLKVIHAGLECGLIQKAYPDMDMVSIGPTIKNAHSPDECVHIGSVNTYWQVLTGILKHAPNSSYP